jgi:hypothetical protein
MVFGLRTTTNDEPGNHPSEKRRVYQRELTERI